MQRTTVIRLCVFATLCSLSMMVGTVAAQLEQADHLCVSGPCNIMGTFQSHDCPFPPSTCSLAGASGNLIFCIPEEFNICAVNTPFDPQPCNGCCLLDYGISCSKSWNKCTP